MALNEPHPDQGNHQWPGFGKELAACSEGVTGIRRQESGFKEQVTGQLEQSRVYSSPSILMMYLARFSLISVWRGIGCEILVLGF